MGNADSRNPALLSAISIEVCRSCGAKNRVARGKSGIPRCGRCHEVLTGFQVDAGFETPRAGRKWPSAIPMRLVVVAVAAAAIIGVEVHQVFPLVGWGLFQGMTSHAPSALPDTTHPVLKASYVPVSIRPGIIADWSGMKRVAPLDILTPPGDNYYVKLEDTETGAKLIFLYAVGGQKLSVLVPPGTYKMKFAFGQTWYGPKYLFGDETSAIEGDRNLEFRHDAVADSGHVVTLIPQPDGNFPFHVIPADKFQKKPRAEGGVATSVRCLLR